MSASVPLSASNARRSGLGNKRPRDDDDNNDNDASRCDQYANQKSIDLLDLGSAIADVFAFLAPADQHKLRCAGSGMCAWFDSAAENGSLAFFVTFTPTTTVGPLRWQHATSTPCGTEAMEETNVTIPQATVTVHARNYCLSTFNVQAPDEDATMTLKMGARGEVDDAIILKATIRLNVDFPFEHKLVVTGLFGFRSIGDGFCRGVRAIEIEFKAEGSQLRSVGDRWIHDCPNLRSVVFAGFTALEEVGSFWLSNCSSLVSISFAAGMPKLKKVEDFWMQNCPSLKQVDLTGLPSLREVGDAWLYNCSGFESITFVGDVRKLKKIGGSWMSSCSKLKHIDLTGFTALEEVGDFWLHKCTSMESIKFASGMPKLKKVGVGWLSDCSKLKHVNLAGFPSLKKVSDAWMADCSELKQASAEGQLPCQEQR